MFLLMLLEYVNNYFFFIFMLYVWNVRSESRKCICDKVKKRIYVINMLCFCVCFSNFFFVFWF